MFGEVEVLYWEPASEPNYTLYCTEMTKGVEYVLLLSDTLAFG